MVSAQLSRHLRRVFADAAGTVSDRDLVERFVETGEAAAFEALVGRHGPMVLGVCRRILNDPNDADDAFQATFLVFLRKVGSIAQAEQVGNWLFGVAIRTAREARARSARRRLREQQVPARSAVGDSEPAGSADVRPLLDEEIRRLPEKYRLPVVLCDLESKSRKEVAEQIGCPEGTLSSRLARARDLLRQRLVRRGFVLSAGSLASLLSEGAASASVPTALVDSTIDAALGSAAGLTASTVPAQVTALAEGVLQAMFMSKMKIAALVCLALGLVGTGTGFLAHQVLAGPADAGPRWQAGIRAVFSPAAVADADQEKPAGEKKEGQKKPEQEAPVVVGVVKTVDLQKNTLTVTVGMERRDAVEHTVPVPDKVRILINGKDQAQLADLKPGMRVAIQLTADQKNVVAIKQVAADGEKRRDAPREGARPAAAGKVKALDPAKNSITITIHKDGQAPQDQTFAVAKDARVVAPKKEGGTLSDITVGMQVMLTLSADGKTVVAVAARAGGAGGKERRPGAVGVLKSIDNTKNQITIAVEAEGGRSIDRTLELAKEVRVMVGKKEGSTLADLKPGMRLQLFIVDGNVVVAVREVGQDDGKEKPEQ